MLSRYRVGKTTFSPVAVGTRNGPWNRDIAVVKTASESLANSSLVQTRGNSNFLQLPHDHSSPTKRAPMTHKVAGLENETTESVYIANFVLGMTWEYQ